MVLVWVDRGLWFYRDEWDMIARTTTALTLHNLFFPHNVHWSTGEVLEYRALVAVFGLRTYVPFLLVLFAVQLTLAHLLWRLMLRIGVNAWIATALAAVFVVLGSGVQNLDNAFQVSFPAPLALGITALLIVDRPGPLSWRRNATAAVLLLLAFMCGPPAFPVTLACVLVALGRRGLRSAAQLVLIPGATYVVWFALIGHKGNTPKVTLPTALKVPSYVFTGLSKTFALNVGWTQLTGHVPIGGIAVVGGILAGLLFGHLLIRIRDVRGPALPAFALALGALFFYAVVAFGRVSLGTSDAAATRYVFVVVALLLPASGLLLTSVLSLWHGNRLMMIVPVICLMVFAFANVSLLISSLRQLRPITEAGRAQVLGTTWLLQSGAPIVQGQLPSSIGPLVTTQLISTMLKKGYFGTAVHVTEADRVSARALLQVSQSPAPYFDTLGRHPKIIGLNHVVSVSSAGSTCLEASPKADKAEITFYVYAPWSVSLYAPFNASVKMVLQDAHENGPTAPVRNFHVSALQRSYLNFLTGGIRIHLIPHHRVLVCGVTPPA